MHLEKFRANVSCGLFTGYCSVAWLDNVKAHKRGFIQCCKPSLQRRTQVFHVLAISLYARLYARLYIVKVLSIVCCFCGSLTQCQQKLQVSQGHTVSSGVLPFSPIIFRQVGTFPLSFSSYPCPLLYVLLRLFSY